MNRGVLALECPDVKGVVAAVSTLLADQDLTITEASQFNDAPARRFFMRAAFESVGAEPLDLVTLKETFAAIGDRFSMRWLIEDGDYQPRVFIGVSRLGHCLYDLIHRWRAGILPVDIVGVFSNHDDMRGFVEWNGLPYFHLPIAPLTKSEQERRLLALISEFQADLVVLARYMQILSPSLCSALSGRCINIHHSFLPSFRGARPYHQAYA
jgi:formyltetrahydrofolate deformylase